jgi:peptide-methionine (S)-S-oxide reductase
VEFDPSAITYADLLTVFFATHDPTSLNRQGNDVGTQYRSAIFYSTDAQKREAEAFIADLNASAKGGRPIVTTLEPLGAFTEAEDYHRHYYETHADESYCRLVIDPKLAKLKERFSRLLKEKSND